MLTICAAFLAAVATVSSPDPEEVFRNPPRSAMTGAWWHWMGSSISKEGIVKDLDWFKRSGIGSVTIFAIADICVPWAAEIKDPPGGRIIGFSEKWWEFVRFACDEAEKRGIEVGLHNCPGYTSTGGPWITSDLAMRQLVFNVTNASEQISLRAVALFPVENADNGKFEIPQIAARHTDIKEIAVVDGVRVHDKSTTREICTARFLRIHNFLGLLNKSRNESQCNGHHHGKKVNRNANLLQWSEERLESIGQ